MLSAVRDAGGAGGHPAEWRREAAHRVGESARQEADGPPTRRGDVRHRRRQRGRRTRRAAQGVYDDVGDDVSDDVVMGRDALRQADDTCVYRVRLSSVKSIRTIMNTRFSM